MDISIVIVSYNVKYFLDQCISSVLQSRGVDAIEIIVVDNASADGTQAFIESKYPNVNFIYNKENVGFSQANNQGVEQAKGEFVLILNPDTLLSTDTLATCLQRHNELTKEGISVGMLGAKMFDGSGTYLPESKRGFPTPFVSFCKIFGLSNLFPTSKIWNGYYLGHLSSEENQQVPILTGAFMFLKRSLYTEVGGFDEDYFMYGEDIDLSYRVEKAGYKNYYIADTKIVHFKGESTKKMTFDYVKRFYEAMIIFAKKHLNASQVFAYTLAIQSAIYLKAGYSFVKNLIKRLRSPSIDALMLGSVFYGMTELWERYYFKSTDYFNHDFVLRNMVLYVGTSVFIFLLLGKYHKRFKPWRTMKILGVALVALLVVYSLLPASIRFSRAVLLIGGVVGGGLVLLKDALLSRLRERKSNEVTRVAVVGGSAVSADLLALLDRRERISFVGLISKPEDRGAESIGQISELQDVVSFHQIDELIFDQAETDASDLLRAMSLVADTCKFKLYTPTSGSVVGSFSKEIPGQIETFDVDYGISSAYHVMIKRFVDVCLAVVGLIGFFILWPANKFNLNYFRNIFSVLFGRATWVGYYTQTEHGSTLPKLKPSVVPIAIDGVEQLTSLQKMKLNFIYAREYSPWTDIQSFFKQFNQLANE